MPRSRFIGQRRSVVVSICSLCMLFLVACSSSVSTAALPTATGIAGGGTPSPTAKATKTPSTASSDPILAGLAPAQQLTVKLLLKHMSLDEKLGQMFLIETTEKSYDANVQSMVVDQHAGAMIVYAQNITSNSQLKTYLSAIQSHAKIKMLVTMDEEGGVVDRLGELGLDPRLPSAEDLANSGDPQKAYDAGVKAAKEMLTLGINTDLAPVVDVRTNPNTIEWTRIFSNNVQTVDTYASKFIQGLHDQGVVACLKHWPGIGSIDKDPHLTLPTLDRTLAEMQTTEFATFQALMKTNPGMIMVTHVIVPDIDPDMPATLSPAVVQGTLRDKYGYQGVVMTDSLYMKGIADKYKLPQAGVLSIIAGDDLLEGAYDQYSMRAMISAIKDAMAAGQITTARINQSVERILALKVRFGLIPVFSVQPDKTKSPAGTAAAQ